MICTSKVRYFLRCISLNHSFFTFLILFKIKPEVGRFITIDDISYIDPEALNRLNLYAYCGNNPVMRVDPTGHFAGVIAQAFVSFGVYIGCAISSLWDESIRSDMNAIGWNPFNSDPSLLKNMNKVSFYNGVPVFYIKGTKLDQLIRSIAARFGQSGGRSFTFMALFLYDRDDNTIRHEWGHIPQQIILGQGRFLWTYAIPSALELGPKKYYLKPWEITADIIGGKGTSAGNEDITDGWIYLFFAKYLPLLCFIFWLS